MTTKPVGTIAQLADFLVNGFWNSGIDGSIAPHHFDHNTITYNIDGLQTQLEKDTAQQALGLWQNVANISYVQTSGAADITFDDSDPNPKTGKENSSCPPDDIS